MKHLLGVMGATAFWILGGCGGSTGPKGPAAANGDAGGSAGTISGTVYVRKGVPAASSPMPGASACVEESATDGGARRCATTASDGTYTITNVPAGPVFIEASAAGWLPGETLAAVHVTSGGTTSGVEVTLSGRPSNTATYVGSTACIGCHTSIPSMKGLVTAWQGSGHRAYVTEGLSRVDLTGWPAEPADCSGPATKDTGVQASDPGPVVTPIDGGYPSREVWLVRWKAGCGHPQFGQALDTNGNGAIDAADTFMPVDVTIGGVASAAGQCSTGGILPEGTACSADYLDGGATTARGWWQQEFAYYVAGNGSAEPKPTWVTWNITGTPGDLLFLPAAWNQRAQAWANAPDYLGPPFQGHTYAQTCTGCHDVGATLATDGNGIVTSYSFVERQIACEKCHGPGSDHANAGGDAKAIVNPAYLTAQAVNEDCGQCHVNGGASVSPAGAFDFAWNSQADGGAGGNFVPGVDLLVNYETVPEYGDPSLYYPAGFPLTDHTQAIDLQGSVHANNSSEKITCIDCHDAHSGSGGPYQITRTDPDGGTYVFSGNSGALADDVVCLSCHATHGDYASVSLRNVAGYHVLAGGKVTLGGTAWTPSAGDQQADATAVASAVDDHMKSRAGMTAYFDPTAQAGIPVGRCATCHMAKTSDTAVLYFGPGEQSRNAPILGDVTSHTFNVATPDETIATLAGAKAGDYGGTPMPNACGSCHEKYRFGL